MTGAYIKSPNLLIPCQERFIQFMAEKVYSESRISQGITSSLTRPQLKKYLRNNMHITYKYKNNSTNYLIVLEKKI